MKLPKLSMPKLVTRREGTNQTVFIGLTGGEWGVSLVGLCTLYGIFAGYFAVLLVAAQSIRNGGEYYVVPGTADSLKEVKFDDEE